MAWFGNCLYFIALLYFTEILSNVMSEDNKDAYEFFLCFRRQICECEGGVDNYKRCYSMLEEKNHQWFVEEINKCNFSEMTSYNDMIEIVCSSSPEEFYPCFMEMEEKLRKKSDELSKNPMTTRESTAMESGRTCIVPNFSMCMENPEDCF
ncbi:uncharacterized protein LOC118204429 isoform X2 [Stegodyphus dumicola]|uniref:uncharacterized protein LOC118204429 isoform X2 n=1 Tax=Stegodyphus dumicola TaxID=202533 RepID=UPI0015AA7722|nr:uncharacterized protein LOC118204429 isoform X2 [Stegodyphus dumicola]XP_035232648.1 uncharacterized protein LOC118204429 isoform X2 [Stegodyphus dumicola]